MCLLVVKKASARCAEGVGNVDSTRRPPRLACAEAEGKDLAEPVPAPMHGLPSLVRCQGSARRVLALAMQGEEDEAWPRSSPRTSAPWVLGSSYSRACSGPTTGW